MNKKLLKLNLITTIILQLVIAVSGLIIPRIIIGHFGSEVNGLISSITQFLNYIQLLEGGIYGVITAALYKALADNDNEKISGIMKAVNIFFRKIALIYIIYSLVIALVFPIIAGGSFSFNYIFSLILIIAVGTFIQYFFSLPYRILIAANRRGYIVSIAHIVFLLFNIFFTLIVAEFYPDIHILKTMSTIAFLVQPLIFGVYVKRNFKIDKSCKPDNFALEQRWSGFGQNLAFFVHKNTDVVILTFFRGLKTVSVYSVYSSIINAVRGLISSVSSSIGPTFGNILVTKNLKDTNEFFDDFELLTSFLSFLSFTCAIVLIVPFVSVYTSNVTDISYVEPVFATLFCLAEAIYVFRAPYITAAYSAGHFKQTAKYAYAEAGINIIISLLLVHFLGLIGVAIGTLVSMTYRMIMHVYYINKNILYRPIAKFVKSFLVFGLSGTLSSLIINFLIKITVTNYLSWFVFALITGSITLSIFSLATFIFYKRELSQIFNKYLRKKRNK